MRQPRLLCTQQPIIRERTSRLKMLLCHLRPIVMITEDVFVRVVHQADVLDFEPARARSQLQHFELRPAEINDVIVVSRILH